MASKQDDGPDPTAPSHSFRVTHVMRPPGQLAGGAEVSTGHLNAHEAMDWIRGILKEHKIGLKADVDPAYGVHPDVAAQLLPGAADAAVDPAVGVTVAPVPEAAQEPPEGA